MTANLTSSLIVLMLIAGADLARDVPTTSATPGEPGSGVDVKVVAASLTRPDVILTTSAPLSVDNVTIVMVAPAPTATQSGPSSARPTVPPRITFVDPPTPKAQEIIAWAVDRYRDAGLQLPNLDISFPTTCGRKKALYHVGRNAIDFCYVITKTTVLHEFAHAWDDTSGAVDRDAFLKLRGLSVWWGGTTMPSDEQGAEHLAVIIAWGLTNIDTRGVPQLPNNSISELTQAFMMLTRGVQPWPTRPHPTSTTAVPSALYGSTTRETLPRNSPLPASR